jgi:hypothetical protein
MIAPLVGIAPLDVPPANTTRTDSENISRNMNRCFNLPTSRLRVASTTSKAATTNSTFASKNILNAVDLNRTDLSTRRIASKVSFQMQMSIKIPQMLLIPQVLMNQTLFMIQQ